MKVSTKNALWRFGGEAVMFSANTTGSAAIAVVSSKNVLAQAAVFLGSFCGARVIESTIYRKTAIKKELREALRDFRYEHEQNDF